MGNLVEDEASRQPSKHLKRKMTTWTKNQQMLDDIKTNQQKVKNVELKEKELKSICVNFYNATMELSNQQIHAISNEFESAKNNEIEHLQQTHQSEIKKLKQKQYYLVKKNNDLQSKMENLDISFIINQALKDVKVQQRADIILDMVMNGDMFGEKGMRAGANYIWIEVRKTYPAWKYCQAKDCAH